MSTANQANPPIETESKAQASERLLEQGRILAEDLKDLRALASELIAEKLEETTDLAKEAYREKKRDAQSLEEKVSNYVAEKPIKSVLMAAGAGALYGMLFLRR